MRIEPYGSRFYAVYDEHDELICVTVYRKGAAEVVRRLTANSVPKSANACMGTLPMASNGQKAREITHQLMQGKSPVTAK